MHFNGFNAVFFYVLCIRICQQIRQERKFFLQREKFVKNIKFKLHQRKRRGTSFMSTIYQNDSSHNKNSEKTKKMLEQIEKVLNFLFMKKKEMFWISLRAVFLFIFLASFVWKMMVFSFIGGMRCWIKQSDLVGYRKAWTTVLCGISLGLIIVNGCFHCVFV